MTLSCNATGNPVPTISWTRDGNPINTTNHSRISFLKDKKQLTITDANRTDSGVYRCVANNKFGNATSRPATLDIQCNALSTLESVFNSIAIKIFIYH